MSAASRKRPAPERPLHADGTRALYSRQPEEVAASQLPIVQVAAIDRYLLDKESFTAASGETVRPLCRDAFDVTLSDGVHTLKCVLSTALNGLVYSGWLRPRAIVRVLQWRRRVAELGAGGVSAEGRRQPPHVILMRLADAKWHREQPPDAPHLSIPEVTMGLWADPDIPDEPTMLLGAEGVRHELDADSPHVTERPLLGDRRHYLRPDSNEVLLSSRWRRFDEEEAEHPTPLPDRVGRMQASAPCFERVRDLPPLARVWPTSRHHSPLGQGLSVTRSPRQEQGTPGGRVCQGAPAQGHKC